MLVHHLAINSRTPHRRSCLTSTVMEDEWIQSLPEEPSQGGEEDFGNQAVRNPLRMIRFLECDHSQKNGQPLVAAPVAAFFECRQQ